MVKDQATKRLLSELQNLSSEPKVDTFGDAKVCFYCVWVNDFTKGTSSVTYELYYTPDHNKSTQLLKVADLEKRISQLEQLIGANTGGVLSFA
jgi:hypothetical protein